MARNAKLYNGMAYLAPNESYARKSATMRPPECIAKSLCHDIRGGMTSQGPDVRARYYAAQCASKALDRVQNDPDNRAWLASREEPEQEQAA